MFKKFFQSSYTKAAGLILICGAILIVFNNLIQNSKLEIGFDKINDTLTPFYIGIILAFLTCPVYNFIVKKMYKRLTCSVDINHPASQTMKSFPYRVTGEEERNLAEENRSALFLSKTASSVAVFLIVVGVIALVIYSILPKLIEGSAGFIESFPERTRQLADWASTSLARFPSVQKWILNFADKGASEMFEWFQTNVLNIKEQSSVAVAVSTGIVSAFNTLLDVVLGLLLMLYLLNNKEHIFAIGRKIVAATCSESRSEGIYEFIDIFNETFIGYLVGRILDSLVIGVLTYIVLLCFGISFAPMIAIVVGVTNVIPFFGPFIGAIPCTLLLLLESPKQALLFVVLIFIIQQLDGNVIGPKIVGNALGINSFWVLVAVLIGGGLFGFMGMLFGTPVFALVYQYIDKLTIKKLRSKDKEADTMEYYSLDPYDIDMSEVATKKKTKKKRRKKTEKKETKQVDESLLIHTSDKEKE